MNILEFGNLLSTPHNISDQQTDDLENILTEFPYFQSAHFLYLNGLKNQNSFKYNDELKIVAAYTSDRNVLFDYITSKDFHNIPESSDLSLSKVSSQDDVSFTEIKEGEIERKSVKKEDVSKKESTLPIGKPLHFDIEEGHSFNEWLQLSSARPIQRLQADEESVIDSGFNEKKEEKSSGSNFELIDKFIAANPKIQHDKDFIYSNDEFPSPIDNDNLMTETLAHVYLEQKKYEKAITAFTVLSLKYPEKNSFFANQIKAIKKLQEK